MELSPKTAFISLVVCVIYSGTGAVVQGPTPVSILAPVGLSFVDFTCNVNLSELPENTFYNAIRWRVNGNILTRMGQAVSGNTVSLQVTTSYISAAASVQCSTKLNGTIEVFSDTTATLTAYGIYSLVVSLFTFSIMLQVLLRHHQTSHQHSPAAML